MDAAGLDPAVETLDGALRRFLGEVLPHVDVEAVALQLVGDGARILGRLLDRRFRVRVVGVADDQSYPGAVALLCRRGKNGRHHSKQDGEE